MRAKLSQLFDVEHTDQLLFNVFALMILLCIFVGIGTEMYFVAGAPAALVIAYLAIVDFRRLFFLLLACIPISTEVVLPNGFGTDLPTEPLMIGLMFVYLLYVLRHGAQLSRRFIQHPITLLVLLHLGWILTTTVLSDLLFVSIKFSLAKIWYISVFYFMAGSLLKTEKDVKSFFWIIFIPLLATVIII
ncbi:MAG: O-antigen ligase family protein, partial [Bacteroidota bacterium]